MKISFRSYLRLLPLLAVAIAPVVGSRSQAAFAQDAAPTRGPYLAQATPDSITVVWRTNKIIQPRVRIGLSPRQLTRTPKSSIRMRMAGAGPQPLSVAPENTFQYEAQLMNLIPDRKYFYGIFDGNKLLSGGTEGHFFRTHPKHGSRKPFRFWVVGDSGTGGKDQAMVHNAMKAHVAKENRPLDFYIHVGDMAYSNGKDNEFQRNYFEPYQDTLRNVVAWPSMGNHEGHSSDGKIGVGPYYDAYVVPIRGEAGGSPSGTEAYYSFDYGRTHFICLNSHDLDRSPTAAMARWLKADLEATRADWIVAFWHHPPYTKGSHDSDKELQLIEMRRDIMPILESSGVDLVLTGHSHIYERSMLIDGAYATPTVAENVVLDDGDGDPRGDGAYRKSAGLHPNEGAVQIVAGHGGTSVRRTGTMPVMKRVFVEHGSVIVDVEGDTLTAIMLNKEGKQRDLFRIVKRGKVKPQRIVNPRQLGPFINFNKLAVLDLPRLPEVGKSITATVEISAIPVDYVLPGSSARVEWNTTGTSWKVEPASSRIALHPGQSTRQPFTVSNSGPIFPLPTATIVYDVEVGNDAESSIGDNIVDGKVDASLSLTLPPYRVAAVNRMQSAPTIDGVLAQQELAGLTRQADFVTHAGTGTAKTPTETFTGLHGNNLYVAIVNHEPQMGKLQLTERDPDGPVYNDDSNELFVSRDGAPEYYQFIVNAAGSRYDGKVTDMKWNGNWKSAVTRGTDRWISEWLIPLDMLGRPVKAGDKLRFNITRNNVVQGESSQWSFTNCAGNHSPQYFGTLVIQ